VLQDPLVVTGNVRLAGVALSALLPLPTTPGASATLIDMQSSALVVGTFLGLAEGAPLAINVVNYVIHYTGGDGNDVTLTVTSNPGRARPTTAGGWPDGTARVFNPSGGSFTAGDLFRFFAGQGVDVRTATADVTGDGVPDIIGGAGPGATSRVVVLEG